MAVSPLPIIAVVLMLSTPKARANGGAFVVGWIAGLAIVGAIVLLLSSGASASDGGAPATWVSVLKLVLGVLLGGVAIHSWRGRPQGSDARGDADLPKWMQAIDTFTPAKAFGMAALLSGANPKNLLLTVSAAAAIAQTGAATGGQLVALVAFVVLGTLGVAIPLGIYFGMGARAEALLASLKDWMAANNRAIMGVLCLVIAAKLIGDGISGLA